MQWAIIAVICVNAGILGLQTTSWNAGAVAATLTALDSVCLGIFIVELLLKLYAHGWRFFRSPWNVFDFLVVAIALVPATGGFAVLRALRALRILRLVTAIPKLRAVIEALARAVPGLASIGVLLLLIFYVGAVMATTMFGERFPEWFGSIGASLYSLFQIMTLESWSMGIVRPVMEVHEWAWAFFIPFILLSAFVALNLFVAVIVDSMQALREPTDTASEPDAGGTEPDAGVSGADRTHSAAGPVASLAPTAADEIRALQHQVSALQRSLDEALVRLRDPAAEPRSARVDGVPASAERGPGV